MRLLFLPLALLAVIAVGCKSIPNEDLVGTWTGKLELTPEMLEKTSGMPAEMRSDMMTELNASHFTLELRKDGTFTMDGLGDKFSDTWSSSEDEVVLASSGSQILKVRGTDVKVKNEAETVLTYVKEPPTLSMPYPGSTDGTKIVFVRR